MLLLLRGHVAMLLLSDLLSCLPACLHSCLRLLPLLGLVCLASLAVGLEAVLAAGGQPLDVEGAQGGGPSILAVHRRGAPAGRQAGRPGRQAVSGSRERVRRGAGSAPVASQAAWGCVHADWQAAKHRTQAWPGLAESSSSSRCSACCCQNRLPLLLLPLLRPHHTTATGRSRESLQHVSQADAVDGGAGAVAGALCVTAVHGCSTGGPGQEGTGRVSGAPPGARCRAAS